MHTALKFNTSAADSSNTSNADRHPTQPMTVHAVKVRSTHLAILHLGVLLSFLFLALPAQATIYKCVDASGNTTYSGTACERDESTRKITKSATPTTSQNCLIAHQFSLAISARLKQGESSGKVFDSFGGMNSLSPASIGLISYIYTFKGNEQASVNRISSLATERCEIGSFGLAASRCDAFPQQFIQSMGGCNSSQDGFRTHEPDLGATHVLPSTRYPDTDYEDEREVDNQTDYGDYNNADNKADNNADNKAEGRADSARVAVAAQKQCKDQINGKIISNAKLMRKSLPVNEMELLRTRHRDLRNQLNRC